MSSEEERIAELKEMVKDVREALRTLYPDQMDRPIELIEELQQVDENTVVTSEDNEISLYYGNHKYMKGGQKYYYTLVFGDPNAMNSEGNPTADEIELLMLDYDEHAILAAKLWNHDKYTPFLNIEKTAHRRRRHILAARLTRQRRKSGSHKGGARKTRRTRRSR